MNVFKKRKNVRIPSQIRILSVWLVWGVHVLCPYVRQGWRTRSILVWCGCVWRKSSTILSTISSSFVWRESARNTIIILCFREQNFSVFVCLYRITMRCNYTSNSANAWRKAEWIAHWKQNSGCVISRKRKSGSVIRSSMNDFFRYESMCRM